MVLIVTVSCHCLSLTLLTFYFGELRLRANLRRIIMLRWYIESKKGGKFQESIQSSSTPDSGY